MIRDIVSLAKPRITLFVVLTTTCGWSIGDLADPRRLAALLIGTTFVVASANTLNCWLERETDGLMRRTRSRPLPAGRMAPGVALAAGLIEAGLALPLLYVFTPPIVAALAAFALVSYVAIYTPLKRVTPAALVIGAVPGAVPPLMGYAATTGRLDSTGLALFALLFVWQIPHFLAITLYLRDDYAAGGLRVLPVVRGDDVARRHLFAWTVALVPASLLTAWLGIGTAFYVWTAGLLGAGFLAFAAAGLRTGAGTRWARGTFLYSLGYLVLVVAVLVVDAA